MFDTNTPTPPPDTAMFLQIHSDYEELKTRVSALEVAKEQIGVLREAQSTLIKRLYGNGQPGDIQNLLSGLGNLDRSHARLAGIGIAAVFVMGVLVPSVTVLIQHFWK